MLTDLSNFMLSQTVFDKIAMTMKHLGLNELEDKEEIINAVFDDLIITTDAYTHAVSLDLCEDLVPGNAGKYTTLQYLMDIVIVQSIRVHAAMRGVRTELSLQFPEEDKDDTD